MRRCSAVRWDVCCLSSYFVHGKADGVHVLTLTPVSAAVLLHESHQEAARHLVVLGIVVFLQQRELKLRVDPKGVCTRTEPASASGTFWVQAAYRRQHVHLLGWFLQPPAVLPLLHIP